MYLPVLLGIGIDELSMNCLAIPKIKRMIRQTRQEDCRSLAQRLLEASTAYEIRKELLEFLVSNFPEDFDSTQGMYPDFAGRDVYPLNS